MAEQALSPTGDPYFGGIIVWISLGHMDMNRLQGVIFIEDGP